MKIYLNGRFLTQSISGVQRYAHELLKAFDKWIENTGQDEQIEFEILAPHNTVVPLMFNHIKITRVGRLKGHLWEQIELPLYTKNGLLINLCNTGPMLKRNQIITIHDAAVYANPENFSSLFRVWYKILFYFLTKQAKKIVTVSSFSKGEIMKYCKIGQSSIRSIHLGIDHMHAIEPQYDIISKNGLRRNRYVLAVGSLNPNKNFRAVTQAFDLIRDSNLDFVIVGGMNSKIFNPSNQLTSNEKYLGYVTDQQLKALYEGALCFVFPSFYEGFGLPPLEAMACGCAVIVSDRASMPEVCGEAALYCNPGSPQTIADHISTLAKDAHLRASLVSKGIERSEQFTWKKCATKMMAVVEEVQLS